MLYKCESSQVSPFCATEHCSRRLAFWLNLSLREVEEMMLECEIDVSYETIRRSVAKYRPQTARNLRRRQAHTLNTTTPSIVFHAQAVLSANLQKLEHDAGDAGDVNKVVSLAAVPHDGSAKLQSAHLP